MRIVAIVRDLGGDERRQRVIEHLEKKWDVVRITPRLSRSVRLFNLLLTASVSRDKWREQSKKNAFFFRAASDAIRRSIVASGRRNGDVVLTFEALFSPGVGHRVVKPFVIYEDGTSRMTIARWPEWVPATARTIRYQQLESHCYEDAEVVLTTNEPVRQSLLHDYGISGDQVTNVGQGHDLWGGRERSPCVGPILFVGYEFRRKGGDILLEAFRRVRAMCPNASLAIVGPEIECCDPGVKVIGRIRDRTELRRIYLQASIFVLPSLFDPMPHATMEAMAMGVPVVVSDACGSAEIIRNGLNGFVVPARNVDALAARLLELTRSEALRLELGREGARTAEKSCSWPTIADRVGNILESVSSGSHTLPHNDPEVRQPPEITQPNLR